MYIPNVENEKKKSQAKKRNTQNLTLLLLVMHDTTVVAGDTEHFTQCSSAVLRHCNHAYIVLQRCEGTAKMEEK